MIGSGLKKFALANGLSVDGGVGYGNFFQGLLFAAIGVVFFIMQAAKKVTSPKMTELK